MSRAIAAGRAAAAGEMPAEAGKGLSDESSRQRESWM
jgi:hypothetical protein